MSPDLQYRIQAWVDDELSEAEAREVASRVEGDAEARVLAGNLRAFAAVLRDAEPPRPVPEAPDFYWSQIRRGIEQADRSAARAAVTHHGSPLRWLAWLVPAGAAALAAVFFMRPTEPFDASSAATFPAPSLTNHEIEVASDEVSTLTFTSDQDGTTVVWLGSLDLL